MARIGPKIADHMSADLSAVILLAEMMGWKWDKASSQNYDKKPRTVSLRCGDWVLIHFPQDESGKQRNLSRPWHSRYRITAINQPDATMVKVYFLEEGPIQVHLSCVLTHQSCQPVFIGMVATVDAQAKCLNGLIACCKTILWTLSQRKIIRTQGTQSSHCQFQMRTQLQMTSP